MNKNRVIPVVCSVLVHLILASTFGSYSTEPEKTYAPVKVTLADVPPPAPLEKIKPPKQDAQKKIPKEARTQKEPPKSAASPVFGVSKDSKITSETGIAVPTGNTLMIEDDGKRNANPGELKDLSRDAQLILQSVKIKYTDEAIDAGLQGTVIVEVLVDVNGSVQEATLKRKVGYKMDDNIKKAALNSKFQPRLDRFGKPQAGWSDVKFILSLE
ncbi:MAG: TonB family protein [Pseudomonadota bacterium]